jgi:hypothetical protein
VDNPWFFKDLLIGDVEEAEIFKPIAKLGSENSGKSLYGTKNL